MSKPVKHKIGEILVRSGLIDEMQLRAALGDQNNWGQRLGLTLVKMGLIEERDLVRALAQQLALPVVQLEGKRVQPELLALVPLEFAEKHLCVPLFLKEDRGSRVLHVGMDDPCDLDAIDELGFRTGLEIQPVLVAPSELCEAIDRFYRGRGGAGGDRSLDLDAGPEAPVAGIDRVPMVEESLFHDLSELEASRADAPAPAPASRARADTSHATILRALCHLLIDKGVISREELQTLVRSLESGPPVG